MPIGWAHSVRSRDFVYCSDPTQFGKSRHLALGPLTSIFDSLECKRSSYAQVEFPLAFVKGMG